MTAERKRAEQPSGGPLGFGSQYLWHTSQHIVDMAMPAPAPLPVTVACAPQDVTVDVRRTAIIVIDMQNDFCTQGGWVDHLGVDYKPDRAPITPLQQLLPVLRKVGVPVIWVNWGNRPDLANMPAQPNSPLQAPRHGDWARRSATEKRRARSGKGFLGRRGRGPAQAGASRHQS